MKQKIIIFLCMFFCSTSVFSKQEVDTIRHESVHNPYLIIDHLDSLLHNWYYYTGRDTLAYLIPSDRFSFDVELEDSVFEERIKKISTPFNLVYNHKVQQYLNRYVKNGRWLAPKFLGLSYHYFPLFEEKLDAYGIPLELKYLPVIESALNPRAKSRMGAMGLWQFMYKTGLGMGLEINSYVDERMDPVKSTDAACRYLKFLHNMYDDWTLALAAYNAGPGTVNKAIRRAGGKTSYWEIYPYLPKETRNYVPGFIAITYLFTYYQQHGFKPEKIELISDFDTVMIRKQLHFAQLDSVLGIPIGESRELNPQYKLDIVPAKSKHYPLNIRREYVGSFIELEDSIYKFQDSIFFNTSKYKYKLNEKSLDFIPQASKPKDSEELKYTVKSGDAIGLIASWYNVSLSNLKAWNGMASNNIRAGRVLKVYVPKDLKSKYSQIDNMSFDAKQKSIGIDSNAKEAEVLEDNYEYYTVKSGDNPFNISQRYQGVSVEDILKLNNISNAASLKIGQKLKIRKK